MPDMSEFEAAIGPVDDPSPFRPAPDQASNGLEVYRNLGVACDLMVDDIVKQVNLGHAPIVQYILSTGLSITGAIVAPRLMQVVVQLPADEKAFVVVQES